LSKFAGAAPAPPRSPIGLAPAARAVSQPTTSTYEGAPAFTRDTPSELFLLAAVNMVGEDTFYEAAGDRDARYRRLIHSVALADPGWIAGFLPYLRNQMQMRSASVVMAAEFARAVLTAPDQQATRLLLSTAGVTVRGVVRSALQRPDEPAELLGYWRSRYGRAVPKPIKRAIADYLTARLDERAAIKYDGQGRAYRLGDVIEVVHPTPRDAQQAALFRWLLDRRRHADNLAGDQLAELPMIREYEHLRLQSRDDQRGILLLDPDRIGRAGVTWEHLAGLGQMDAQAWTAVIPQMGYMALLRNLRNFDEAGVSDTVAAQVAERLSDPAEVLRSRQFPYRFLSAYRSVQSDRWAWPLSRALEVACRNVPELPGRTLLLWDTSASMTQPVSIKSTVRHVDVAGLFAMATALTNPGRVDLIGFADGAFAFDPPKGASVLRQMEMAEALVGSVGHGTQMLRAIANTYEGHDRVLIFSDLQTAPYLTGGGGWGYAGRQLETRGLRQIVPAGVPVFGINTAGYAQTPLPVGDGAFYEVGGFTDRLFTMVATISAGRDAGWPWETSA
jgi:hypothetical protein